MLSVSRSRPSFHSSLAHVKRIVAQADWDARPTFCYRLRAALRDTLASLPRGEDSEQRSRAIMRAAEHFSNALRPNFTPAAVELTARIEELEVAGLRALDAAAPDQPKAA